jgi:hypothetical protein
MAGIRAVGILVVGIQVVVPIAAGKAAAMAGEMVVVAMVAIPTVHGSGNGTSIISLIMLAGNDGKTDNDGTHNKNRYSFTIT